MKNLHPFHSRILAFLILTILLVPAGCQGNSGPSFSGSRAFGDLKAQVAFGPRVPGSAAHEACKAYLLSELKKSTPFVEEQKFSIRSGRKTISMTNLIAHFNPNASRKILLLAHWDSRPFSDQALDTKQQNLPVPGANDGASGVAVLLELARLFKARNPGVGVTILLDDGEDWGRTDAEMLLGARYYAKHLKGEKFDGAILLDMIGDKDLQIYREGNSEAQAKWLNDRIWKAAADLGHARNFPDQRKYTIIDDHIPLQEAGIPAVDLIDFDYPYWHTPEDTADKCSPSSLKTVGDVVAKVVYEF